HAVVVKVNGAIRVAGTAEFAGYDNVLEEHRIVNLTGLLKSILPEARYDTTSGKGWCGLRAMSVDGVPVIGPTPLANLFVNTGHGHLGWTMAAGSARLLTDILCGQEPLIDPSPFTLARFARA